MPGFVDVSGMTYEQVRRMGHADDEAPLQTWKPKPTPASVSYSADNVWGAACAAQRINGSYVKETQYRFDEDKNTTVVAKQRNRDIMIDILANPAVLTVEDIAQGQACRKFLQNDLTLRTLKGQLNDFDRSTMKVLAVNEEFNTAKHKLELAVVACLPASQERALARQEVQGRMRQANSVFGTVGAKVTVDVEIIGASYSHQYGIYWINAITQDNCAVFFSHKNQLPLGNIQIRGTVKAHRDGKTQLNRVSAQ